MNTFPSNRKASLNHFEGNGELKNIEETNCRRVEGFRNIFVNAQPCYKDIQLNHMTQV